VGSQTLDVLIRAAEYVRMPTDHQKYSTANQSTRTDATENPTGFQIRVSLWGRRLQWAHDAVHRLGNGGGPIAAGECNMGPIGNRLFETSLKPK
jgi:hypothetical protein